MLRRAYPQALLRNKVSIRDRHIQLCKTTQRVGLHLLLHDLQPDMVERQMMVKHQQYPAALRLVMRRQRLRKCGWPRRTGT